MKKSINLNETQLASLVAECVRNTLGTIDEGKRRGNITDAEKAFRRANRDLEHERNGGRWIAVDRPHKNKKVYDRKRDKKVGKTQEDDRMGFAKGNSKYYHDSRQWESVVRNLADDLTKDLNENLQRIR